MKLPSENGKTAERAYLVGTITSTVLDVAGLLGTRKDMLDRQLDIELDIQFWNLEGMVRLEIGI